MPNLEFPDPGSIMVGDLEVELDLYQDRISAEWGADIPYTDFIEASRRLEGVDYGSEVFVETPEEAVETSLGEAEVALFDSGPEFAAVYGSDYSLRWEAEMDTQGIQNIAVGAVVDPDDLHTLADFIEHTTEQTLSDRDYDSLQKAFENVE